MADNKTADIEQKGVERISSMNEGHLKEIGSSDYDEYLRLQEVFVGERLKRLTRKIEYVLTLVNLFQ